MVSANKLRYSELSAGVEAPLGGVGKTGLKASEVNRIRGVVFAVVGVVALGGAAFWMNRGSRSAPPPAAPTETPSIPAGRLQTLRVELETARYLAVDQIKRTGDRADVQVVVIGRQAGALESKAATIVERKTLDCSRNSVFDGTIGYFDLDGRLLTSKVLAASKFGRPATSSELELAAVCSPTVKGRVLPGFRPARREVLLPPEGYVKFADAHPQDADAWAWICAGGARGVWRKSMLADCARAIRLNPDDPAVRLDRGYLMILLGRPADAAPDFDAVLAKSAQNAVALYGRSLVLAMRHDEAGSRKFRGQALDLDPDVVEWVIANYRIQMSQQYRVR
jgi:hypothetical protein